MTAPSDLSMLLDEYRAVVDRWRLAANHCPEKFDNNEYLETLLVEHGWTHRAAEILLTTVHEQGIFMLRNELSLAIAMNIEDGDLGF